MKKKALAGIIAFICTVNMFSVPSMLNPTGTGVGISSYSTVYAEETITEPLPSTVSDSTEYWNNTYYTTEISEAHEDCRWEVGACVYSIFNVVISHEVFNGEDNETVIDFTDTVVGLVSIREESRLTSHTPFTKTTIPNDVYDVLKSEELNYPSDSSCVLVAVFLWDFIKGKKKAKKNK